MQYQNIIEQLTGLFMDLKLSEAEMRLLEHRFAPEVMPLFKKIVLDHVKSKFSHEVCRDSDRKLWYSFKPLSISEQIIKLTEILPNLDTGPALDFAMNLPVLPNGAEAYFAVPRDTGFLGQDTPCSTLKSALETLAQISGKKLKYNDGESELARMSVSNRTVFYLKQLYSSQDGDIIIFPVQLGMQYRCVSGRNAEEQMAGNFQNHECGLRLFELVWILVLHPELLSQESWFTAVCTGNLLPPEVDDTYHRIQFSTISSIIDGKWGSTQPITIWSESYDKFDRYAGVPSMFML